MAYMTLISLGRLPNQAILPNSMTCLFRQHDFMQLCRIRQPNPKFIRGNWIINSGMFSFFTLIYYDILKFFTWQKNIRPSGKILNILIYFIYSKMIKGIAIVQIQPKTLIIIWILRIKIEKQEMNYLYHRMDCGIVLNFMLPKSVICCQIRQCCLIGQSAGTDNALAWQFVLPFCMYIPEALRKIGLPTGPPWFTWILSLSTCTWVR